MLQILDYIWQFLVACFNIIVALVQYFIDLLADISYMINLALRIADQVPGYFLWLPPSVFAILGVTFGIVVVFKIIGREG